MKKGKGYPLPLGVSEREHIVNFSVAVEKGKECRLHIYRKDLAVPEMIVDMPEDSAVGNVRFVAVSKKQVKGREYNYEIDGEAVLDPYVKSITERFGTLRGKIIMDSYDWEGDKPLEIPAHQVIAYSLHVRGFTKHRSSKVKKKGTFRGMIEKIPYLVELGINQIQCMPVYDFDENTPYRNYWGYGHAYCFAVKKYYAAGHDAENELKDMVKEFHKHGIEVVLNLPFTIDTPKHLIVDCLRYYVMEYHVDGFVMNPYAISMDIVRTDAILKRTKIIENKDAFQNAMRCFLRGDKSSIQTAIWEMRRIGVEKESYNYITNQTGFTLADLVSYNKKHNEANGENNCDGPLDNYSWNCGREGNTRNDDILALRKRQRKNAMALLLLSQGTPVILSGDEFGNSQKGNNNVYCQDNEIAWLDWKGLEKDKDFWEYVKGLIAIRKQYTVLGVPHRLTGTDTCGCGVPDVSYHTENAWKMEKSQEEPYVGIYYHGQDGTDCFVAYNMQDKKQEFALPILGKNKRWIEVFSTAEEQCATEQRKTIVEARTITMFIGR